MRTDNQEYLRHLRHTASHLMAAAVLELWPETRPAIGPAIENGFYYDFDFPRPVTEEDLAKIEQRMREIVKGWDSVQRLELTGKEAREMFGRNPYKKELIEEFESDGQKLTAYKSGGFADLCEGGHIVNPKAELKHFKLLNLAGAYWRGDEKKKMLTRIYGTAFPSDKELKDYLWQLEEARKRDHRKLGKKLDLFTFSDYVGSGLPIYTPRGALVRRLINEYVEEVQATEGYRQVWTPQIAKAELFKVSGHYDKYKDDMFMVRSHYSEEEFFLKPMNCPQHTQIYASRPRSYRDLPIRMTDFAMLYRDEKPGELSGLSRVRSFSQDDCHVFCRLDQVDEEIDRALSMTKKIMATYGFKYRYRLSVRDKNHPEKYIGDPKEWDMVEEWAEKIMKRNKIDYYVGEGEAAFYAPKMDLMATDALGREWQLSTVQIDMFMPKRFNLEYTDKDGSSKQPVMIHRAIVGSPERFMMILLEHYAGALPVWLSPDQAVVVPVSDKFMDAANDVRQEMSAAGIRTAFDAENKTLSAKIREWTLQKVPYICIIGEKEVSMKGKDKAYVSVRTREGKDLGLKNLYEFINEIKAQIEKKA